MAGLPRQSLDFECGDLSVKLTHTRNIFHLAAKVSEAWRKIDANSSWDTKAVLRPDYKNSKSVLMTLSRARAMLTTPAGKHWIKMKLPTAGSKLERSPPASTTMFILLSPPGPPSQILSLSPMSSLLGWGGFAFPSLCREVSVLKPLPSNVIPQIRQPDLGTLPLNLFLSSSSWLIPSLTHHDTNSFYLLSLWSVSIASHLIKTGHTQGRSIGCQVPCYTPRDRQVFV